MNQSSDNKELYHQLKDVMDDLLGQHDGSGHPPESLPMGTYIRAQRYDRLGVIVDSFYGDVDKDGKKIIVYTVLLFPEATAVISSFNKSGQFYLSNEYEYEITAYLMMNPIDIRQISHIIGGDLLP